MAQTLQIDIHQSISLHLNSTKTAVTCVQLYFPPDADGCSDVYALHTRVTDIYTCLVWMEQVKFLPSISLENRLFAKLYKIHSQRSPQLPLGWFTGSREFRHNSFEASSLLKGPRDVIDDVIPGCGCPGAWDASRMLLKPSSSQSRPSQFRGCVIVSGLIKPTVSYKR